MKQILTLTALTATIALNFATTAIARTKNYEILEVGCAQSRGECGFIEAGKYKIGDITSVRPSETRTSDRPILITFSEVLTGSNSPGFAIAKNEPDQPKPHRGSGRREAKADDCKKVDCPPDGSFCPCDRGGPDSNQGSGTRLV